MRQPGPGLGGCEAGQATEAAQPEERQPIVVAGLEAIRRGGEHEATHDVRVAPPDELGDGATHRVPDDDRRTVDLGAEQLGDVVGAVLEPEPAPRADAGAVATVVEGEDAEVLTERVEARPEVEGGRRGPAVQEDHGRRARRTGDLAEADRAGAELDVAGRRERRRGGAGASRATSSNGARSASVAAAGASVRPPSPRGCGRAARRPWASRRRRCHPCGGRSGRRRAAPSG